MKIITTTVINISEENQGLLPLIVSKNGRIEDGETLEMAIKRMRDSVSFELAVNQIVPHLKSYFGEKDIVTSTALEQALREGGIEVSTEIV